MYDMQGLPVWYFVNGSTADERGDVSLRVLANHDLVLGPSSGEPPKEIDLAGNVIWQGPPSAPSGSSSDPATAPLSHYAAKLDNGNYVIFRNLANADGVLGALVQELSPQNEVVWSWNLFDHEEPPADAPLDWCHPNSVTVDLANDVFYLSCRYRGIRKAKRSGDQAVLWVLGGEQGGDFSFEPPEAAIFDQHDPEIHADGTILVFDNHYGRGVPPDGTTSRAIEFKLDESSKVATPTFEFPGTYDNVDDWYKTSWQTSYWGDADRLANGNVLVCAGQRITSELTHVFEIRPSDGAVVWQITLPMGVGSYQAERLSPPPLVEPL
ncbi:MAG TPA: aryl-sulfate sulfotransferase, partial [Polyangiaceae bacterium]|nr:aryl-sulfate sulfotransferase [Polyangiaceae bacterium]